ncbi:hypothetical protein [Ligilactobacillus salitolerans]|uniref:hypothetical protein n=1 Tax=Ligilactobacillus salitolerans TaxID=1808352 RepID=UPI000F610106|nr:hypothetical protein [Ligilactobacillus salitolerans]
MGIKQKHQLFLITGIVWLLLLLFIGLSFLAWFDRPNIMLIVLLVVADFIVISAACSTAVVCILSWRHSRAAQNHRSKK